MKTISIYESNPRLLNVLRFTFPTVIMMVFASMYGIIDGIFLSNFIGSKALSANNIVYPLITVVMAVNLMFATGSNAIIAKKMGEGKQQEANRFLSLVVLTAVGVTALLSVIMLAFDTKLYALLGADSELMPYCVSYGTVIIAGSVFFSLQILFQNFLVTAERPGTGMGLTIAAGCVHIGLDLVFIPGLGMGIEGAALASVISMMVAGIPPLFMFAGRSQALHFEKPALKLRTLGFAMANGSSEMVTNLATAVTTMLFNLQMMHLAGEKGVAAISAVLYVESLFISVFLGFSSGAAPLFSYYYGAGKKKRLSALFKISFGFIAVSSAAMFIAAQVLARPIIGAFAGSDAVLQDLALHGLKIFSFSYLLGGISVFGSSLFTALNNGLISALISLVRTLLLRCGALILFPVLWGIDGVWLAVPVAEVFAALLAGSLIFGLGKKYGYLGAGRLGSGLRRFSKKAVLFSIGKLF